MQPPAPRDLRGRRAHHPDRNRTDRGKAFYPIRCPQRARARRAPIPASTDVDRPARAGWAALRLLADVALFSGIVVRRFWFGATMELGRSGRSMMMMDAAPAAPHLDLLGPPGWCSGCWPHDGDVAGGAGFLFSDTPVRGRRWSSGDRSDRRCGRCGATGPTAPTPRVESRVQIRILAALILVSHFSRVIFRTFGRKAVAKSGRCTSRWRIRRSTYFRSARGVAGLALAANWLRIVEAAKD
jgi:hypothetical protein